jgi:hypothetical protein
MSHTVLGSLLSELLYTVYVQIDPFFLNLCHTGGEWSASRPGRFTSGEGAPSAHWVAPEPVTELCSRETPLGPSETRTLSPLLQSP